MPYHLVEEKLRSILGGSGRGGSAYLASHRSSGFLVRCKIQSKRHCLEVLKVMEGEYIKFINAIYA